MNNTKIKTYSELIKLQTYEERFNYLRLDGSIGVATFGFDRYFNQAFYTSREWRRVRNEVITRDNACDLGIFGLDIYDSVRVHHMNPISIEDLENSNLMILDPEFLISTSLDTHNAIHFGRTKNFPMMLVERRKGDTTPWKVY